MNQILKKEVTVRKPTRSKSGVFVVQDKELKEYVGKKLTVRVYEEE